MGNNNIKTPLYAQRAKKRLCRRPSPPQELEVSQRSGLYLLVLYIKPKTDNEYCCGTVNQEKKNHPFDGYCQYVSYVQLT